MTGRSGRGTVNLFVAASPLHVVCSERIRDLHCAGEESHLFYNRDFLAPVVSPEGWTSTAFLPWPRHYPLAGPFGRWRRLRANLAVVREAAAGASAVRLHAPVIDTEATNYFIRLLQGMVPPGAFSVRLVPDGILGLRRWPLGRARELAQQLRRLRGVVDPSLRYYAFRGCRTGADAPVVDRIYTLPGFTHEYDPAKVVELPPFHGGEAATGGGGEGKALVLGQPLVAHRQMGRSDMDAIGREIRAFLEEEGVSEAWYKKHPRDGDRELFHPSYRELVTDAPLERFLASNPFGVIVSVRSTALVTARLVLGERCRVVSFGLDRFRWADGGEREAVLSLYRKLGIEMRGIDGP